MSSIVSDKYDISKPYSQRIIQRLSCPLLNGKPNFETMKKAIQSYYQSPESLNNTSITTLFYNSLVWMMRVLINTKDTALKDKNLNKLYAWFEVKRKTIYGKSASKEDDS